MSAPVQIESRGNHEYLVRGEAEGETVESLWVADPGVLEQLGAGAGQERWVVEQTVAFVTSRQSMADLPQTVYLEDVAAAYDDYLHHLRMHAPSS
jgi:transketolase